MTATPTAITPQAMPVETARRLLLGAQGLLHDPQRRATPAGVAAMIERMGFVQVDTINVVERAHHLILASRFDDYQPAMLTSLLERQRRLFEHWTHDASVIPTKWFPHWRHRHERYRARIRRHAWWKARLGENPDELIAGILQHVAEHGPVLSKDFERDSAAPPAEDGWWGWKPQKAALEHLWRSGELAVLKRVNFQKVYDLTERVFPEHHTLQTPSLDEHVDWACRTALERLGAATPGEIAAFWNAIDIPSARQWCRRASSTGEIVPVLIGSADGSKPRAGFAMPNWKSIAARLPDPPRRLRLFCPFDPVIRDRKRAERLFNFDYVFEAFVPAPKRKHGYYVLPMLEGERLVGRLDPKFHRNRGVLEVRKIWWEAGIKPTKARRSQLDEALERLASFIGASKIERP